VIESLAGLVVLLLEGLAVCIVAAIGYTVYALTHPTRRTYASAVSRGRPGHPGEMPGRLGEGPRKFESWTFRSRGMDLPVWDFPGDAPDGPVVIFSHGWGDSRIGGLTRVPYFLGAASRIVLWDMPGHGEAPGTCALGTREVEDLLTLIGRVNETERGVVLFGWSLGAGVSICAANEPGASGTGRGGPPGNREVRDAGTDVPARGATDTVSGQGGKRGPALTPRVRGVIAEAPYRLPWTPARNVMRLRGLPWKWNMGAVFAILGIGLRLGVRWRGFDRAEHAAGLECPLLVLHGSEDEVCPVEDGREIAAAAKQGRFVEIEKGRHFGLWTEAPGKDLCGAAVLESLANMSRRAVS